jgi:N-acetylglucosaminyldiphosphoundecaprenol N-acetyl-beta-D-mannosaminyltransferase
MARFASKRSPAEARHLPRPRSKKRSTKRLADPSRDDSTRFVELLGHRIDRLGLEETAVRCRDALVRGERTHHVSLNAAKIVRARDDERLAGILRSAQLVNADGQSIVWASRLLGDPLPERVAGIDLMSSLLDVAEAEGFRVYFLGARPDVLDRALVNLRMQHPQLVVAGAHHGYFDASDNEEICNHINSAGADMLFVAMSSPRKEYWVAEHAHLLEVALIMGVGGALDVVAGVVVRAPRWIQDAGLEWAFRLFQEPRRMWRRYLLTNTRFVGIVLAAVGLRALRHISHLTTVTKPPERSDGE